MRKIIFFVLPVAVALIAIGIAAFFFSRNAGKGALQVTSIPKSQVFLNGKPIGRTPLCKCELADMFPVGEHTLRLVPQNAALAPFEEKIPISQSVLTVVDRTFGEGSTSEGSIITLQPLSDKKSLSLLVVSFPDEALVLLDKNSVGTTPLLLKNVTDSDHEITVQKDGYKEKTVRIRTAAGYKLSALVYLGVNPTTAVPSPSPTASPSATPTPVQKVVILQTPTGFLRVRDRASLNGSEIARVGPGEIYELVSEQTGWFEVKLSDGKIGFISTQYAKKQ